MCSSEGETGGTLGADTQFAGTQQHSAGSPVFCASFEWHQFIRSCFKQRQKADELAAKDAEISTKTNQLESKIAAKDAEIDFKVKQLASYMELISANEELTLVQESEIEEKDGGLASLQERCGSLQTQLQTVQSRMQASEVTHSTSTACAITHNVCA